MMMVRTTVAITLAFGCLVASATIEAQQSSRPRIGVIATTARDSPFADAFRDGLRSVGYLEGRNVVIEWQDTEAKAERTAEVAMELVRHRVDVIVAVNNPAVVAAQKATTTIPIVMVFASDPVALGFVASLARPGGNTTGFAAQTPDVIAKRLQLLKDAVPGVSVVGVLWDPGFTGIQQQVKQAEVAAQSLGIRVQPAGAATPNDFESAFAVMTRHGTHATLVLGSSMHYIHRARIAEIATKQRLPTGCLLREFAEAGCLMSYAPNLRDLWRRSAIYVDKILKGAKAGDLPVEQPTKFELVINLKTAKTLGLTIPPALLLQADQVIE